MLETEVAAASGRLVEKVCTFFERTSNSIDFDLGKIRKRGPSFQDSLEASRMVSSAESTRSRSK